MAAPPPSRREDFTVAVVCALPLEYDAAELAFDELWDESELGLGKAEGDTNHYGFGRIGKHNAVLLRCGMGKVNAASATASLRSSYCGIKLALLCGICGGVPPSGNAEMLLGDVIISENVIQYDLGRQYPSDFESKDTMPDSLGRPIREVRSLVDAYKTRSRRLDLQRQIDRNLAQLQDKAVKAGYEVEYTHPQHADVLFRPDYVHRHRNQVNCDCSESRACEKATKATCDELGCDINCSVPRRRCETLVESRPGRDKGATEPLRPFAFIGSVGSGDTVMKSGAHRDGIARRYNLIAFEMEGAGVWDEIPCVVVKGVCDYADSHKNKGWQHYAAATAAAATKALLDRYVARSAVIQQTAEVEKPGFSPKFLVPYVKNPDFVGREDILGRITTLFGGAQNGHVTATTKRRSRVALHGLGGVGKTQIALAYAYGLHETSPKVSVFWVHASNRQRFRQAFTSIAQVCGIPGYDGKKADPLLLVKQWLESDKSGPWLLIIDNADDKDLFFTDSKQDDVGANAQSPISEGGLDRFIPECLHGTVLITTRDMQTGLRITAGAPPIKVDEMIDAEAIQLLRSLLPNRDFSPSEAIALASRLEYLPLALAQAASFILKNSISINAYLRILDESDSSLVRQLSEPFASIGRDSETPHAPTATWLISFRQIEQQYPLAGNLLSFMSMFDRQAIPKEFLTDYCYEQLRNKSDSVADVRGPLEGDSDIGSDYSSDPETASTGSDTSSDAGFDSGSEADSETTLEVTNALGVLQAFSFISQASNDTYDMHRLVHLVTNKRILHGKKMPQFSRQALEMMSRTFPFGCFDNRAECLEYLPHALAILAHLNPRYDEEKVHAAELLYNVAHYFGYLRQHPEAEKHMRRALELRRGVYGQNQPVTLMSMSGLASAIIHQDRPEEGIELLLPTLDAQKRLLTENHRQALYTRRLLANAYLKQKRYEAAMKLVLKNLEICEGDDSNEWESRNAMYLLSLIYFEQGRYNEAEQLQLHSLERLRYEEDSVGIIWPMTTLGLTYAQQGRLSEAGQMLSRALARSRTLKGEGHYDTVKIMVYVGSLHMRQGSLAAAEELLSKVLVFTNSSLGEEHEDTIVASIKLASVYGKQGRLQEAEELLLKVLDVQKTTKGDEHEDTMLAIAKLGRVYKKQGRLQEAEELLLKVLDVQKTTKGEEHEDTILAIAQLGRVYSDQGRLEEAEGLWLKAFERWKTTKGEEHKDTVHIMGDLGLLYSGRNRLVEAEELQQRALQMRRKVSGEKHVNTLTQENNLAWTWWDQGRKGEAIQLMLKCAKARECVLGRDHKSTKNSLEALSYWKKEMEAETSSEDELESASEDSGGDGGDAYVGSDDESDDGEGARL